MKATLASGNETELFSACVDELIHITNYYLKSGYFSPTKYEIGHIFIYFDDITKRILYLKSNSVKVLDIHALYNNYCKIKHMLKSSVFINVTHFNADEISRNNFNGSLYFNKISVLYNDCKRYLSEEKETSKEHINKGLNSFEIRDVFLGVLRNREQLDICLEKGFYHIPADRLEVPPNSILYIAIYQSENIFGSHAGIRYYGRVDSYNLVKRKDITEIPKVSDRLYYRFNISSWQTLTNPIKINGGGRPFHTTSLYLLLTSSDACELEFKDPITCKLYRTIKNAILSKKNRVACHYRNVTFAIEDDKISLYKNRVNMYSVPVSEYLKNPSKHFWAMLSLRKNNTVK